ncbi:MAG TPA: hypothetical protein VGO60_16505, partial [Iamia sp.]|nr:hypothetical protein [Iamia sp.]
MPRLRTPREQLVDGAIEDLEALTASNRRLRASRSGPGQVRLTVGDASWPASVIAVDALSAREAQMLVASEGRGSKIIVANQISEEAKDVLAEHNRSLRVHGWSWLDRRGELQLNHPTTAGTLQFTGTKPGRRRASGDGSRLAGPSSDGPIRGRAGISCAAALLLHPDDPPSIRAIAREAQMSHGAIGEASKLLRSAGLVRPSGQPEVPDLFWGLAAVWAPTRVTPVAELPTDQIAERLRANAGGPAMAMIPGWCVAGDEAALAWGAPMFVAGSLPWVWVPTEIDARRAERQLAVATWDDCAAVVAVPPTALVTL